jgi:hypothetical protein
MNIPNLGNPFGVWSTNDCGPGENRLIEMCTGKKLRIVGHRL